MKHRLPPTAAHTAAAELPPAGLEGLDPAFSRIVSVPESGSARSNDWHILDNGQRLKDLGLTPAGTVLCVHGNPTWSYLWRRFVTATTDARTTDAAAPAWRVIAVDQLDMGFSERTGVARPLARRVADLGDLTDTLAIDGPVFTFGHDWGGVISLGWAIDHPDQLAGIMLLNTAVHQPHDAAIPAPLRLALRPSILGRATVATPAFLETTLALAHPPLDKSVKAGYRAPYRAADRRFGIGRFVADIPVDATHESFAELERIATRIRGTDVPALMLWGPRDPIFSDRYLDDLVERLPQASVHRFEGAGHLLAEDVDYAAAAITWLGDHASAGRGDPAPPTQHGSTGDEQRHPLWRYLDELRDSDETAIVDMAPPSGPAPRVVSWKLLSRRVRQIAAGLVEVGVQKGDRVSLLVPPGADLTAVLYACVRIGAVVVVADAGLGIRGLSRAVRGARPDFLIGALPGLSVASALGWPGQRISTTRLAAPVRRLLGVSYSLPGLARLGRDELLPTEPGASDPAAVLFTSGSTGPAKGVVYTHGQLSAVRDTLASHYGIAPGTGLVAGFAPFALLGPALGTRSVTPDMDVTSPKTLTASAVAAAAAAVEATVVFLSPAALANVVATESGLTADDRSALRTVRTFLSAGAPVSERLLTAAAQLMPGASAHTPYGMTEGLLMADITLDGIREALESEASRRDVASNDPAQAGTGPTDAAPGGVCVGTPTASARIRISAIDGTGAATGDLTGDPHVTGEIVISAAHVEDHYDRLWLTDRASRVGAIPGERWHRTGDVGHFDVDGRLWVEGRLPHVITTPLGVVTPVGPEQRAETVAGVARAAVVGVGPRGTQQVVVVVETSPTAIRSRVAAPLLAAAVREAVVVPVAAVLVVRGLPTDIRHNSKIDRTRVAQWAAKVLSGGRMSRP